MSHRCFAAPSYWEAGRIRLSRDEAHHLQHVLRAGPGDDVIVFDGQGRECTARVPAGGTGGGRPAGCVLEPIGAIRCVARPRPLITLMQAVAKGHRMDLIVEKATELGVSVIIPVCTERVVARMGADRSAKRRARWQRISLNAAKQSGACWLPEVRCIMDWQTALAETALVDARFVGVLDPEAPFARDAFRAAEQLPGHVAVAIGPEGDLTPAELAAAVAAGMEPVHFGRQVLRVETAALFALAVLRYEFTISGATTAAAGPVTGRAAR